MIVCIFKYAIFQKIFINVTIKHLHIYLKVSWDEYSNCYCNFSYFIGKLSTHSETLKRMFGFEVDPCYFCLKESAIKETSEPLLNDKQLKYVKLIECEDA